MRKCWFRRRIGRAAGSEGGGGASVLLNPWPSGESEGELRGRGRTAWESVGLILVLGGKSGYACVSVLGALRILA